ncbi:MAG: ABC transporter permease [Clostridiales Family XIII bacterium]|jgi:peptide/nickel transport system permease protein|nr:ABC transporter permease [Clostridiales Family XIII bacterium]
MEALKFVVKKLVAFTVSITVLSFIIFSLLFLAPGDPARVLVGARRASPEALNAIREQYHLNDSFFSQYFRWVGDAAHLDFGNSIRTGSPVTETISSHLSVSLELVLVSLVLSIICGIVFGVIAAKRRGKFSDKAINFVALVGTSAPSFAAGLLLLYVFALILGWFPVYGIGEDTFADRVFHLTLPAIALTIGVSAMLMKVTRSAMLNEVDSDYTVFMRARTLSPLRITFAQLKNASGPILTSTGLVLASLIGATVLVETTFAIPGVGNLLASSVTMKDVPVVQFLTLVLAFFICLSQALVDIAVYFINPASRAAGRGKAAA